MIRPELAINPRAATVEQLLADARSAEAEGLDAIAVSDHLSPGLLPPLLACTLIAGATSRVRIGTLVLNNDFRHPVLVAREAAALDEASGGRFELGLGAGYMRAEYERSGIPWQPGPVRIARLGESLQILRRLLAGETVDHVGTHYTLSGEQCYPVPAEPIPLLVGGNAPAIHELAQRHADVLGLTGFSFLRGGSSFDAGAFSCAGLERQLARLERPPELHALVQCIETTPNRGRAAERAAASLELPIDIVLDSPYVLIGSAREIAIQVAEHGERFGIRRFTTLGSLPEQRAFEATIAVRAAQ